MSFEKWSRQFTLYPWPLWRNWKPPKPLKVETLAEQRKRQITHKPTIFDHSAGINGLSVPYPWKLWHQHKPRRAGEEE